MGTVLLCARLGGMAVSAYRSQTRSVPASRLPECLLKSRMCERHLSGSVRAWAATFGEHPVYSTTALVGRSLLRRPQPTYEGGCHQRRRALPEVSATYLRRRIREFDRPSRDARAVSDKARPARSC